MGFSKKVCSRNPDRDNAPPRIAAIRILGKRIFQIIFTSVVFPALVNSISAIRFKGIGTLPMLIFITVIRQKATIRVKNTNTYRVRRFA